MSNSTKQISQAFYDYLITFLHEYVELFTYLSLYPLYGEIVEVTPFVVVLDFKSSGKVNLSSNESSEFYVPLNSIISVKKL